MNLRVNHGVLAFLGACTLSTCTMPAPAAVALTPQERAEIKAQIRAMREEEEKKLQDAKLLQQLEKAKEDLAKAKK